MATERQLTEDVANSKRPLLIVGKVQVRRPITVLFLPAEVCTNLVTDSLIRVIH